MDEINVKGLILTPLRKIYHPKGEIFHGIKRNDKGFFGFGEAYFSTIKGGQIKGWNKHKKMTSNLIVPIGEIIFVIYDDREKSITRSNFFKVTLSLNNYYRLTVPPGLWIAFKGISKKTSLMLNVADMEHDPEEIERLDLEKITYTWD